MLLLRRLVARKGITNREPAQPGNARGFVVDSRRRRINPLPPVKDVRRDGWNLWESPGMWTGTVRPPRDFAAAAAAAWLGLLLIGAVVAGFVLAGIVIGRRERTAGLLHIYGACRVWLQSPAEPLLALASAGPALVFISAALGGVSSLWDTFRARTLVRGFRAVGFQQDPRVAAIARRLGVADRVHVVSDPEPYALTAGFWRPAIFLSTGMTALLEGDELEAVLRHELAHVRRRDPLKALLGRAARRRQCGCGAGTGSAGPRSRQASPGGSLRCRRWLSRIPLRLRRPRQPPAGARQRESAALWPDAAGAFCAGAQGRRPP